MLIPEHQFVKLIEVSMQCLQSTGKLFSGSCFHACGSATSPRSQTFIDPYMFGCMKQGSVVLISRVHNIMYSCLYVLAPHGLGLRRCHTNTSCNKIGQLKHCP